MERDLLPFIQARRAKVGNSPRWQVVRHLLKLREFCQDIVNEKVQCSVLGQQAALMFAGTFDETLQLPSSNASKSVDMATSARAANPCAASSLEPLQASSINPAGEEPSVPKGEMLGDCQKIDQQCNALRRAVGVHMRRQQDAWTVSTVVL